MDQELSQEEDEPRCSKRARPFTSFGPDFLTYLLENEPRSYSKAMSSPEAPHRKEAINSEIESIMQSHTWKLVDLPPENKPLGCKWIFKRKMKADRTIEKYKVRTNYAAYLVFKLAQRSHGLQTAKAAIRFINQIEDVPYNEADTVCLDFQSSAYEHRQQDEQILREKRDGWMEIKMGELMERWRQG
ncbi:hypothetical protein RJ639_002964 [Escallonia herrerae]|uniref:Reverse transcriptase n=1 Tax=Escallonia herrerae TaxID=1293975 RepID=A0AA88W3F5_9ASTE|nr:hypothetical protein RJ639_002964 [Escallonia herrerae]